MKHTSNENTFFQVSKFYSLTSRYSDVSGITDGLRTRNPRVFPLLEKTSHALARRNLRNRLRDNRVTSISSLAEVETRIPSSAKVISFDFFDTLATRVGTSPQMITRRACEFLLPLILSKGALVDIDDLVLLRRGLEGNLRADSVRLRFRDPETTITDIYKTLSLRTLGYIDEELVDLAVQFEIELEANSLFLVKDAFKTLEALYLKGFTLVITSEMYIEEKHLRQIASKLGIERFFSRVFVSSTSRWMKGSGHLYTFVAKELGVSASEILHIGDNPHADIFPTRALGMPVLHLSNTQIEAGQELPLDSFTFLGELPAALNVSAEKGMQRAEEKSDLSALVQETIAPVLALFIHDVLQKSIALKLDHVYFIAREGVVLHSLFEKYISSLPEKFSKDSTAIGHSILFINRKTASALGAPSNGDASELLRITMARTPSLELPEFLGAWNLDQSDISPVAVDEYKRIRETHAADFFHESIFKLLDDPKSAFGSEFRSALSRRKTEVLSYLTQEHIYEHERVGFVDLGWEGTIPVAVANSIFEKTGKSNVASFLFATSPGHISKGLEANGHYVAFPGFAIDGGRAPLSFVSIADCAGPLEVLLGADHLSTTNDYEYRDGIWASNAGSISQPNPQNLEAQAVVARLSSLVIEELASQFTNARIDYGVLKAKTTEKLLRFLARPTHSEANALRSCTLDMGDANNEELALVSRIRVGSFFSSGLLNGASPFIWIRGTFALSRYPEILFRVYELYFLAQYLGLGVTSLVRRILKWSPF